MRELHQRLIAEGWVDPWLDEEKLKPGQTWTATIQDAIDSADSVLIFLSKQSVNKEGFVQRELKRAWKVASEKPENVIFIIPFRLDDCEVPRKLRAKQWGDYFGESKEKTYAGLLVSLKQRHMQKLELEKMEQDRATELDRDQKESEEKVRDLRLAASFNEAMLQRTEERIRRERAEAQLAAERAQWEEERKSLLRNSTEIEKPLETPATAEKESPVSKPTIESVSNLSFSTRTGSSLLIDSSIVHFESLGRGRPIIFLHGWVGSWRYWFRSMQVASRSFRSYALDLWGFGDTAHNPLNYSLEQQSTLLERFLNEMGIGKIALVGHGLGALVGMKFATRFPQSVDRVLAISCPLHYDALNSRFRTASPFELSDWLSSHTPEAISALSDATKADSQAIRDSLISLQAEDIFSSFRSLNIPCLLVYGERDPAVFSPDDDYSMSVLTHTLRLENSGHFPMIDDPNTFERLLVGFLTLQSGVSPHEIVLR